MKKSAVFLFASLLILFGSLFFFGCGSNPTGSGGGPSFVFPTGYGSWEALASVPEAVNAGGSLRWAGGNYLYAFAGSTEGFYRYDIAQDTWEAMEPAPANVDDGGCLVYINGYLYASRGGSTQDFWRYDIAGDTWEAMPQNFPATTYKGSLANVNGEIYVLSTGSPILYKYNIGGDSFTTLEDPPVSPYHGCSMVWDGDDTVYMRNGNGQRYFWKYSISGNSHTLLASYEGTVRRDIFFPFSDKVREIIAQCERIAKKNPHLLANIPPSIQRNPPIFEHLLPPQVLNFS